MRVLIRNQEFYIFKGLYYTAPAYYYHNANTSLVDKFFTDSRYRSSLHTKEVVEMLINSSKAKDVIEHPQMKECSKDEQLEDFLNFLKTNFNIHMDEKNRFYTIVERFGKYLKVIRKQVFFSWHEMIQLYNLPHQYKHVLLNKNEYLKRKYEPLNELNKKFVYVNLIRIKGKGFTVSSKNVITLPK